MRLPRLLVVAALAGLGACNLSTSLPTSRPLGIVVLSDTLDAQGHTVMSPVAHFFNGSGVVVPDSRVVQDSCLVIPYLADTGAFPYNLFSPLNAGDSVIVQAGDVTTSLFPALDPKTQVFTGTYDLKAPPLAWTPGTPVSVTVPGATGANTYPSASVSAATAAGFSVSPIAREPDENSFTISYAPAGGTGSAVVFAIGFDTVSHTVNPVTVHLEMYCSETDTGNFQIPVAVARVWRQAAATPRNMRAYRWQTTIQNNAGTGLIVIAQHNEYAADAP
ncbi:MAG TPA: hypothetical protein VJO52_13445 [Gemmatimonadaceae bacterium]|nr:hypothetical protein [Gemmatimonadaceae bacterium]